MDGLKAMKIWKNIIGIVFLAALIPFCLMMSYTAGYAIHSHFHDRMLELEQ